MSSISICFYLSSVIHPSIHLSIIHFHLCLFVIRLFCICAVHFYVSIFHSFTFCLLFMIHPFCVFFFHCSFIFVLFFIVHLFLSYCPSILVIHFLFIHYQSVPFISSFIHQSFILRLFPPFLSVLSITYTCLYISFHLFCIFYPSFIIFVSNLLSTGLPLFHQSIH